MFAVGFNIKVRRDNYFYCAEFVKYLIEEAKLELKLPELVKPIDFKDLQGLDLEYRGMLKNYRVISD